MNYNEFFNTLAADASRNYKIDLLTTKQSDETLQQIIFLALDPFTQFYQRKIPYYMTDSLPTRGLKTAMYDLKQLSNRSVTGHEAIDWLTDILETLSADDAKVIERIIQKDLKCGVAASTVNNVWPGLVHEYPCMLCSAFDQKLVDKIKFPAYVQLKMDGMRFNAIVKDGKCEFRSRNGKEIQLLGCLEQEFVHIADGKNVVFDGELLVSDKGVILDRQTGNGILNKAVKGTISDLEANKVHATIWDLIPYEQFMAGKCSVDYHTRFSTLEGFALPTKIRIVESKVVGSFEEAQAIFEKYLDEGQEGIILKSMSGIWEDKRSKNQIKFKGELECDLVITGVQMGTGKYEGMLGAVHAQSADGVISTSIGSGFTDEQRKSLLKEKLLGKIIAVKYNARIKNKQGGDSLFLPIVLEIREDKFEADHSKDIK
jgi:hypothetical protein